MSQLNAQFVKTGYWIDQSRGQVMGKTITTITTNGNIVIALLAVITTFGLRHFWNVVIFIYHQNQAKHVPADGLHHQQQVLLRTLPAPGSVLTESLKLWWVWRKRAKKSLLRSLPLLSLAFLFTISTITVGIVSSYVVDSSDITILVSSPNCSTINYVALELDEIGGGDYEVWSTDIRKKVSELADTYSRDCYGGQTTTTPERCKIFVRPMIPSTHERTPCPFEESMCKKKVRQPGFVVDTGMIDIGDYIGLNLATKDAVKFRQRASCAVLELEGHYKTFNASSEMRHDVEPYLGRKLWAEEQGTIIYLGNLTAVNYTLYAVYMPVDDQPNVSSGYKLRYSLPSWNRSASTFKPIPSIQSDSADLALVFLRMHGIRFLEPVDDPLFSAHKSYNDLFSDNTTEPNYGADQPVSVLGCHSQSKGKETCTSLQGLPSRQTSSDFPVANEIQLAIFRLMVTFLYMHDITGIPDHILTPGLFDWYNPPLPKDQWAEQVLMVENLLLAKLQIAWSIRAVGPSTLNLKSAAPMLPNATAADKSICYMQKMKSPGGFVNINVFALAFVVTFCVLAVIIDLGLLKLLILWSTIKVDAWTQNGVFHLQRRAYEAQGEGVWERLDKDIPATTDGIKLAKLPVSLTSSCSCAVNKPSSTVDTTASDTQSSLTSNHVELVAMNAQSGQVASSPQSNRLDQASQSTSAERSMQLAPEQHDLQSSTQVITT